MEFHAYILCGNGRGLSPFSKIRTTGIPKALLPIANRPMIEYVLEWCDKAFFPQITIVCDEESRADISKALDIYQTKRQAILTENSVPSDNDGAHRVAVPSPISILLTDCESSGDVMYTIYANATRLDELSASDGATTPEGKSGDATAPGAATVGGSSLQEGPGHFVLLPCDFITDLPPQVLIDAYRNKSDTDLGLFVNYRNQFEALQDKKIFNKTFALQYTAYTELPDGELRLLDLYSQDDVEFHKSLVLRSQMSWRHANVTVSTKLLNSTIFFGDRNKVISTIADTKKFQDSSYFKHRSTTKIIRDFARSSWKHSTARDTVGLFIVPEVATFFRCNNVPVYLEANRHFMKQHAPGHPQHQLQDPNDKLSAIIGTDSLVGSDTILGERTNVKRSIVGSSCKIGKRVKLTGCVILNHVVIEDDVHLENCIIGHNVLIQSKVKLTNCNVESTLEVAKGKQAKGETILVLSLEGIEGANAASASSEFAVGSDSDDSGGSDSDSEDYSEEDFDEGDYDNSDGLFAH